jgi:hypothetical protein
MLNKLFLLLMQAKNQQSLKTLQRRGASRQRSREMLVRSNCYSNARFFNHLTMKFFIIIFHRCAFHDHIFTRKLDCLKHFPIFSLVSKVLIQNSHAFLGLF